MARPDSFTDFEKQWIKNNYETAKWEEILQAINGKTKQQISEKAHSLGVCRKNVSFSIFSKEEEEILKKYYRTTPISELIEKYFPNRTRSAIETKANKIGVSKRGMWTETEDKLITENYYKLEMNDLKKLFPDRAKSALHCRIKELGLSGAKMYKYKDEDIKFVKDNYMSMSDEELGSILHRNAHCIKEMRRKNKIYRQDPKKRTHYASVDRFAHRNNVKWKKDSAKKCNYQCFVTGDSFEEIHHLVSKNQIIKETLKTLSWNDDLDINKCTPEEKQMFLQTFFEIQSKYPLGICLTKEIHTFFHNEYGYGNNTIKQFAKFIENHYPEKLDEFKKII